MNRKNVFELINQLSIDDFRALRKELGERDSFFKLMGSTDLVSKDEKTTLSEIFERHNINVAESKALTDAAWAVMSRSTKLE